MQNDRFDALTRFMSRTDSRRALLRSAGAAGLASIGLNRFPNGVLAQDASPVASPGADPEAAAQAAFDAARPIKSIACVGTGD